MEILGDAESQGCSWIGSVPSHQTPSAGESLGLDQLSEVLLPSLNHNTALEALQYVSFQRGDV